MKIVFFGLGSIGQRHARLLQETQKHDMVAFRHSVVNTGNSLGIPEVTSFDALTKLNCEVAFICNPTHKHIDTALACLSLGINNLFIEKPLDATHTQLELVSRTISEKQSVTYVAYVLRFHPLIQYLKSWLPTQQVYHARLVNASYLPDWRPGTDYKTNYAVSKASGGGVILDCSHEIDLANYLFGPISNMSGNFGKSADITIDSEDFADILFSSPSTHGSIYLSYVSKVPERRIEIETANGKVVADLAQSQIQFADCQVQKFPTDRDDWYRQQLAYFFDQIQNPKMMNCVSEASDLFRLLSQIRNG